MHMRPRPPAYLKALHHELSLAPVNELPSPNKDADKRTGHERKAGHPESSSSFFHLLPFPFLSARKWRCQQGSFLTALMSYRTFPPFLTEGKSRDSSPQLPMAGAHPFGSAPKITLRALNNFLPAGCSGPSCTHRQEFHRLAWNLPLCFAKSFELLLSFAVPEEQGEICGRTGLCVCGASHSQNSV